MADHQTTIKITFEGDDKQLRQITEKVEELLKEDPTIKVDSDTSQANERLQEVMEKIGAIDGESPAIKPTVEDNALDNLDTIQKKSDELDGLSPLIKPTVDDSEALGALNNIQNQVENMTSGLESGITGILGTLGAEQLMSGGIQTAIDLDKAWRNWVGSLQQTGMSFNDATKKADQFKSKVNELASTGQSNDALFKNIAGLVINLNSAVSDSTLQMTEKVVSGYEMLGGRSGATLYEMEKELKDFLSTGSLGKMADTISSTADPAKWKGLLEGAKTAEERIDVLRQMLEEEGIMGALNIDAPSKSIDQLKAIFDAAMTNIGTTLITMIKPIADVFTLLDDMTGGLSTTVMSVIAVVSLLGVAFFGLAGMITPVLTGGLGVLAAILPVGATSMSLTAVAAGEASLSFGLLGASIWAALAPILPFIAAGAAIAGAIYLIGDALGYWKDLPSLFGAISDGLGRIWDSFINNKHIVGIINTLKSAWDDFVNFFVSGWNSIFGQDIGKDFDVVRGIIDIFGLLGDTIANVWDYLTKNPIGQLISGLFLIGNPLLFVITHFEWLKTTVINVWDYITNNPIGQLVSGLLSMGNPLLFVITHFKALSQAWDEFTNSADGQELFASLGEVWSQLQAAFNELGPAFNEIIAAFQELWAVFFPPDSGGPESVSNTVSSVGEAAKQVNPFIQATVDIIRTFGLILQNIVIPMVVGAKVYIESLAWVFERVAAGIRLVNDVVGFLINSFNALISGQMSIPDALATIWGAIVSFFKSIFNSIIAKVVSFGSNIISKVGSIFSSTVHTAKSFMSKLPGIVWTEMINVANKIGGAANYIFQQVKNTFGNIVYWAKKVLGIASPGFIANAISGEMDYVASFINDKANKAYNATKHLSNKILDGFDNNNIELSLLSKQNGYFDSLRNVNSINKVETVPSVIPKEETIEKHFHFHHPLIDRAAMNFVLDVVNADKSREESRY